MTITMAGRLLTAQNVRNTSLRRMMRSARTGVLEMNFVRCFSASTRLHHDFDYDLIVIGGGPAGFAAATRAWDLGKTVCIIEKTNLGGAGVWDGALASKTMWQLSRRSKGFKELLSTTNSGLDYIGSFPEIQTLTQDAERAKSVQYETQLEALSKGPMNNYLQEKVGGLVTLVCGIAQFCGPNKVRVVSNGRLLKGAKKASTPAGIREMTAENFLICVGSRPRELPNYPTDGVRVMTSDHIMRVKKMPESIAIVGAGVIGCEFAAILSNLGQSRVHLINERRKRLLPTEDEDLSSYLTRSYQDGGVNIHNNCKLLDLDVREHEVEVRLGMLNEDGSTTPREPFTVSSVLFSVGRTPCTDTLNLDGAGVKLLPNGAVETNGHLQSVTAPHIYSAGDCTYSVGLVSVAEMEGRHAVEHMYTEGDKRLQATPLTYDNVSSIMFLRPEISCVGMNEQEARRQGIAHRVARVGFALTNRGIINRPQYAAEYYAAPSSEDMTGAESVKRRLEWGESRLERSGFVKMIVADDDEHPTLLGLRVAGEGSSSVIEAAAMLIHEKGSCIRLENVLHPHPSLSEAVQDCARMLMRRSIYKPHVFSSCWVRRWLPAESEDQEPTIVSQGLVPSYGFDEEDMMN